jgi:hypothetical protein
LLHRSREREGQSRIDYLTGCLLPALEVPGKAAHAHASKEDGKDDGSHQVVHVAIDGRHAQYECLGSGLQRPLACHGLRVTFMQSGPDRRDR